MASQQAAKHAPGQCVTNTETGLSGVRPTLHALRPQVQPSSNASSKAAFGITRQTEISKAQTEFPPQHEIPSSLRLASETPQRQHPNDQVRSLSGANPEALHGLHPADAHAKVGCTEGPDSETASCLGSSLPLSHCSRFWSTSTACLLSAESCRGKNPCQRACRKGASFQTLAVAW